SRPPQGGAWACRPSEPSCSHRSTASVEPQGDTRRSSRIVRPKASPPYTTNRLRGGTHNETSSSSAPENPVAKPAAKHEALATCRRSTLRDDPPRRSAHANRSSTAGKRSCFGRRPPAAYHRS